MMLSWCIMIHHDVSWCIIMYHEVPCYSIILTLDEIDDMECTLGHTPWFTSQEWLVDVQQKWCCNGMEPDKMLRENVMQSDFNVISSDFICHARRLSPDWLWFPCQVRAIPRPALRSWSGHLTRIGQNRFAVARWNVIEFPILYSYLYTYLPIYLSIYLPTYLPIYSASIPNFCTNPWVFGFQSGLGGVSSHRSLSIWLHAGGAWAKGRRDWWHLTWFDGLRVLKVSDILQIITVYIYIYIIIIIIIIIYYYY